MVVVNFGYGGIGMQPHLVFFGDLVNKAMPDHDERFSRVDRNNKDSPFFKFVGNENAVMKLQVAAYKALSEPSHIMRDLSFAIFGPASTGKTTLARIYSQVVELPFIEVGPKAVKCLDDLFSIIDNVLVGYGIGLIEQRSKYYCLPPCVIFIDEVHALPNSVVQGLLKATEFNDASMATESGRVLDCYAATWMIATTEEGQLFDAFRTRFSPIRLEYLSKIDIARIVKNSNTDIPDHICNMIVDYNPRVPRKALEFARYCVMYRLMYPNNGWEDTVRTVAMQEGLNSNGLNNIQIKVLEILNNGPISKRKLSDRLNKKEDELENYIIPDLLAQNLVYVNAKGYNRTENCDGTVL